jgi:hypothetical protein
MMTERKNNRRARLAARAERIALRNDLGCYSSPADRLELSALLYRHDDAETAEIRELVDLTRVA